MTVIDQSLTRAQTFDWRRAVYWLIGLAPFVAGFVIGLVVRVVKVAVGFFLEGYARGAKIR